MKKHFVTFASSDLERTLLRIKSQATELGVFDHISCYNESNLSPSFKMKFKRRLRLGTRGFGYWCWKPQILLQTLQEARDGDIVLYCDAGCEINPSGIKVLESYFSDVALSESGFLVFQLETRPADPTAFFEEKWTKEDLFSYFEIPPEDPVRTTNQIVSGIFAFRVSKTSRRLIQEWLNVYCTDFDLATDRPSRLKNSKIFIEHRHDQSIFSLLIKRVNAEVRSFSELEPSSGEIFGITDGKPIIAARNKHFTFASRKKRQLGKFIRKLQRVFS